MPLTIRCPMCQSAFTAGDHQRGQRVLCPGCRQPVQLPAAAPVSAQAPSAFTIACPSCRSSCRVTDANRGKQVMCPKCRKAMTVPAGPSAIRPASASAAGQALRPAPVNHPVRPVPAGTRRPVQKKSSGLPLPLLIGGGIAAVLFLGVLVVGGAAAFWLMFRGSSTTRADATAQHVANHGGDFGNDANPNIGQPLVQPPVPRPERKRPPLPPKLDRADLKRVKASTVFIRVRLPNGQMTEGSGFFGAEKGIVLTNAHVIGMLKSRQRPRQVDIVYKSGEPDSRTFNGEILGVDRSSDLAVLRVQGAGLPEPLQVAPSKDLFETQEVFIFGFPLGSQLGKNITVSKTTISSLRKDDTGHYLERVQVNGGMHPGNSGGPVVDTLGDVVGVAVSGIIGTQINFAVPGDRVQSILNGRIAEMGLRPMAKNGDQATLAVNLNLINPLGRLRKAGIVYWTGNSGKSRPPTRNKSEQEAGDSAHQSAELPIQGDNAKGTITLPALQAGKVYWVRPFFVDGRGEVMYASAGIYQPGAPGGAGGAVVLNKRGLLARGMMRDPKGRYVATHTMRLEAGHAYTIDVMSNQIDPVLVVLSENGGLEGADDDGGEGLNSRLVLRPRRTGTYRILVSSYDPGQTGTYTLRVRRN